MDLFKKRGGSISRGLVPFATPSNAILGRDRPTKGSVAVPDAPMLMYGADCPTRGLRTEKENE